MASSSNVDQLFAHGTQLHNAGHLPQALQVYEQVLGLEPRHFDALHHTGIAAFQSGNFEAAARFIRAALAVQPDHPMAHNNLGNALREMQLMEEALRSYERALALDGNDANTHFNRAVTLQSLLRVEEALQGYDDALSRDANDDQAWNNRATLLWQSGQHDLALVNAEQALALNPHNLDAHLVSGNILLDKGRLEQAEESYRQALALAPDYADVHYHLGRLLLSAQRPADALAALEQALSLHPQLLLAHRQRALALRQLQRLDEAQRAEADALALQHQLTTAYRQRGGELEQLGHNESAAAMYATALEMAPDDAELQQLHARTLHNSKQREEVVNGLREALRLKMERASRNATPDRPQLVDPQRNYESALIAFEKLTKLAPRNAGAYINLGAVLQGLGLMDQALENFEKALAIVPDSPLANFNRGLIMLGRGDYEAGWKGYEWRFKSPELPIYKVKRRFLKPQWTGRESLKGKTLLIYSEQGYGDAVQFSRYATLAKQRGAKVILEVWGSLAPLMGTLKDADQVVVHGESLPAFDYHSSMMSLPLAFDSRVDTVPVAPSYLSSDPVKRDEWQARLGARTKPRVGLVWSGSASHGNDHNRSVPLAMLAPILSERYEFICLQKEIRPDEQELLKTLPVRDVSELLTDFSDTAALCDLMDIIITVDTSVAHLAGALGRPVWILLPTPFEWRWLEQGRSSHWYPSATLYRQQQMGDWQPVIDTVSADLQQWQPPQAN